MNEEITPLQTDLASFVKLGKADFIGKAALAAPAEPDIIRVGLEITGRGIVREACPLYAGGDQVGQSTSGTHCPFLGKAVAMALIDRAYSQAGTELEAEVRGRRIPVRVVPLPFYKRAK